MQGELTKHNSVLKKVESKILTQWRYKYDIIVEVLINDVAFCNEYIIDQLYYILFRILTYHKLERMSSWPSNVDPVPVTVVCMNVCNCGTSGVHLSTPRRKIYQVFPLYRLYTCII